MVAWQDCCWREPPRALVLARLVAARPQVVVVHADAVGERVRLGERDARRVGEVLQQLDVDARERACEPDCVTVFEGVFVF